MAKGLQETTGLMNEGKIGEGVRLFSGELERRSAQKIASSKGRDGRSITPDLSSIGTVFSFGVCDLWGASVSFRESFEFVF